MEITPEIQKALLENPNICPLCKGTDIEAGHMQADNNYAWCITECENCGASWEEVYTLNSICNLKTKGEAENESDL